MHTGNQLWIYAPETTSRLSYITGILFDGKVQVTAALQEFLLYRGPRINYSNAQVSDVLRIAPYGLLEQTGIHQPSIACFEWNGLKAFFPTGGDIPFDIFSASFYLLARYEEYLPYTPDKYGRYPHTESLAYREGFLQLPLVNLWAQHLYKLVEQWNPGRQFVAPQRKFRFLPTYDVDIAYRYQGQPVWKNVLGFFRDLAKGKIGEVMERGNVYNGRAKDPFDVFDWLDELHAKYRLHPAYFLLTIIKRGPYDKNLPHSSPELQRLYKRLAKVYVTGLHPSWQSGTDEWLLRKEKQALERIVNHTVFISRNHYLRFTLPHTYRRLLAEGFTDDHSMAYGSVNGFRASYAMPYRWYDLEKETETHLVLHPFCFMEATAFFEQGLSVTQARDEMQYYYDTVRSVNGQFITLFHNHFLTDQPDWICWREMYGAFLEKNRIN